MTLQEINPKKAVDTGKGHNKVDQKSNENEIRGKIRKMIEPIHGESLKRLYDFTYRLFTKS